MRRIMKVGKVYDMCNTKKIRRNINIVRTSCINKNSNNNNNTHNEVGQE